MRPYVEKQEATFPRLFHICLFSSTSTLQSQIAIKEAARAHLEEQDKMLGSHLVKCLTAMIREPIKGDILNGKERKRLMLSKKNNLEIYVRTGYKNIGKNSLFFLPNKPSPNYSSWIFTAPKPAQPAKSPIKHPKASMGKPQMETLQNRTMQPLPFHLILQASLLAIYHSFLNHWIGKFIKT